MSKEQISEFDKLLETYKKEPSQENKNSVLEKVKSFGLDVLSNIISNIILG